MVAGVDEAQPREAERGRGEVELRSKKGKISWTGTRI